MSTPDYVDLMHRVEDLEDIFKQDTAEIKRLNACIATLENERHEYIVKDRVKLTDRIIELKRALRSCLNYIEHTESELEITLSCGLIARAAFLPGKDDYS